MNKFFEGKNLKYVLLAVVLIIAMIIWLKKPPGCSSFSVQIEGVELHMDSYELCDDEQIKQFADSVFQAGAKYAVKKYEKIILSEKPNIASNQTMGKLSLQVENEVKKRKVTVRRKLDH